MFGCLEIIQFTTGTQVSHLRQPAGETPAYQSDTGNYKFVI